MRFSNDVVAELKTRLLRTKANGFKFTDAEAKDAASVLGLSVEQVKQWNQNVHKHYKPYEHEKESHMEKIEAFLSGAKVSLIINIIRKHPKGDFWTRSTFKAERKVTGKMFGVFNYTK